MLGTMRLQEWIHRLEVGGGARFLRWLLALFGFIGVAVLYDSLCFRNFTNPEAMDAAQLARNLAEGKGYTTDCVRPFSMALIRWHRADQSTLIKKAHPDISNPPLYPILLAPLLRVTPAPGDLLAIKPGFTIYAPELWIALLNQALLGIGAILVFRLALGWFNRMAAWTSAILFVLTELYWRFSVSGLSTMLLIDLILLLVWLLNTLERGSREGAGTGKLLLYGAAIGAVLGAAMLTRYSAGWLLLPVLVFVLIHCPRRFTVGVTVFVVFASVTLPWVARNISLSGWAFGTATFAPLEDTFIFPTDTLERSLAPTFKGLPGHRWQLWWAMIHKTVINVREIITMELPRMGGNWLWAFFLVGLLVRFQDVGLNRLRWFTVGALAVFVPVQACARTHFWTDVPVVNAENLLVVFSPLVLIFGVGLFFVLFDSWSFPSPAWHYGALAGFLIIVSFPMWLAFAPPRPRAVSPPYYPPRIQQVAHYLRENEMLMSDIPWAIAWYGQRQCVWLTANGRRDFFEISDFQKAVNGLYVSTRTTDSKFFSNWFVGENQGWGAFLLQALVRRELPQGFPLKQSPEGLFANGELLLMDRDRWTAPEKNP
jgi:4-amino-4-deoxy-L-arabinose transferase-like glycosyltransferase